MTYQIIYSSVSTTPLQIDELEDLLEHAQANNACQRITGALVYADGHFLQVLEGEQEALDQLMRRIVKDLRHEAVVVLQEGDIETPAFADWDMAYVSATAEEVACWAGLGATSALPQVWKTLRDNAQKTEQVTQSIRALLAGDGAPHRPS